MYKIVEVSGVIDQWHVYRLLFGDWNFVDYFLTEDAAYRYVELCDGKLAQ